MSGLDERIQEMLHRVQQTNTVEYSGRVSQVVGMAVESEGPVVKMGDVCKIYEHDNSAFVYAEVVGFRGNNVLLMPFGELTGIGVGSRVVATGTELSVPVGPKLQGRVLNALGQPIDGKGSLCAEGTYPVENEPPDPMQRRRIHEILPLGVRAIDSLLTLGDGQRVGIFAGSGVGKSTLLGMIARRAHADINVIALVGERGREVLDFMEKDLQEEGLKKSVLIVATSDQPALLRLKSAMTATAVAEYFRDAGKKVLLMMDSLTRFAMAQREIGMAVGEPPVSRGYPPSVYAMLPKLLERSGTSQKGSITGIYTVLVEGDDMNEPISDTVRGILDGHIVLSRKLANNNHYPAIDVLASISRLMPDIVTREHYEQAGKMKNMMTAYNDARDMISIGAYKPGANPETDEAIRLWEPINRMLMQKMDERCTYEEVERQMAEILGSSAEGV